MSAAPAPAVLPDLSAMTQEIADFLAEQARGAEPHDLPASVTVCYGFDADGNFTVNVIAWAGDSEIVGKAVARIA